MKKSLFATLLIVCFFVTAQPVSAGSQKAADLAQHGPYEVGFTSFVLTDPSRNAEMGGRPIPVYLWYPVDSMDVNGTTPEAIYPLDPVYNFVPASVSSEWEAQGFDRAYQEPPASAGAPFPLVVFSPGWGGPAWGNLFVGTRLASHGIAVAITYHWGDAWWPWEPFDHIAVASMNRPLDISFMLTGLLARNGTPGNLIYNVINPDQVAASGHSLGGYAAMTLAGGDDSICDKFLPAPPETCVPSATDPRIKTIVTLDGSNQGLWFDELSRITIPTMGMGQEWSTLQAGDPDFTSWQARQHAAIQGHPTYRVDLADAWHLSFSNGCEAIDVLFTKGIIDEPTRDIFVGAFCAAPIPTSLAYELITQYMIAFLKTNLAGEQGYQNLLTPGSALKEPYIEFFVTEKRNPNAIDEDWPGDYLYFMHQPGSGQANAAKDPEQALPIPHLGMER
jgi:hypothetical protein